MYQYPVLLATKRLASLRHTSLLLSKRFSPDLFSFQSRWQSGGKDGTDVDPSKFTHEIKIHMPEMGEGSGKVLEWYKKEGDLILKDDVLCDIETKDFSFGMVTDDECDAIMGEIIVEAGSEPVEEGAVICTVLHPEPKKSVKKESEDLEQ